MWIPDSDVDEWAFSSPGSDEEMKDYDDEEAEPELIERQVEIFNSS